MRRASSLAETLGRPPPVRIALTRCFSIGDIKRAFSDHAPGRYALLNIRSQLPRSFAANRLKRPMSASSAVESGTVGGAGCTGIGALSLFRLYLMKTRCQLTTWHSEHLNVWCSPPGTITVSSLSTFINIISPPHAIQRIARTRSPTAISQRGPPQVRFTITSTINNI
jgi:hypothetical protein